MTLEQMSRWRRTAGTVGGVFCLLIALGILDALIAQVRTSPYTLNSLPGDTVSINGPMPERIKNRSELTYQSSTEDLTVEITRIHTGYWLGGNIWTGVVHLGQDIAPASHQFMVRPLEVEPGETFPVFELTVHEDHAGLQASAKSFIKRVTGLPPWMVSVLFLPLAVLTFVAVYKISAKREALLLEQGKGEVVRVKRVEGQVEIALSLGTDQGYEKGTRILLYNNEGKPIASIEVVKAWATASIALADASCPTWPGQIVSKMEG
jgi:hypothetical protein